jgi:WD40 repeat protein
MAKKSRVKKSYSQKAYLGRYPYNLIKSGNLEKYYQLLTNFDFIQAKINYPEFGVQALIEDYDLIEETDVIEKIDCNQDKINALKLIQDSLRLSSHILAKDKTQLVTQLWGRLKYLEVPEITTFLEKLKQIKSPWLCPLTLSFTPPGGRLLRTLIGHRERLNSVAIFPDGKYVISGSSDQTIKIWDLKTGEEVFTFKNDKHWITALAITPDGKQLISASGGFLSLFDLSEFPIKIWNLEDGKEVFIIKGHNDPVNALAITPNGKNLISASSGLGKLYSNNS